MKKLLRYLCMSLALTIVMTARSQVPALSSYPFGTAVIFLDFDGHTVEGTSWNWNGTPIECASSGLTDAKIIEIFNRVAEDFRPFNLNITTDSTKFLAAPIGKRMRVIVTTSHGWYSTSYGGIAFTGSFVWGDDSPSFVFSALQSYNAKIISESVSHEAGHTLGLHHQASYDAACAMSSEYHFGVGTGEIGWAPIMGVGYYKNFTLWNNGPNLYGCANYQNDLEVITSPTNGFTFRPDDHGNTFEASTLSIFANKQFTASGVVERNTDQDIFHFIIPFASRFQLDAIPYNVGTGNAGSDLDMQVTLFNSSLTPLNIYNPGALLSSLVDTTLAAGTYYVRVEGKGNQYAPSYGSLGSYSLLARFDGGGITLPIRRLELRGELNGDKHQLHWMIDADEMIKHQLVEVSTDGRNFEQLIESASDARSYFFRPQFSGTAQYRLAVTFENGQRFYSNIITIRESGSELRPKLLSNLISGNIIRVMSPGSFEYAIIDLNGRMVCNGVLTPGNNLIEADRMIRGMHIVRFTGKEQHWTDKILRQ
jgi:hypothetical protein